MKGGAGGRGGDIKRGSKLDGAWYLHARTHARIFSFVGYLVGSGVKRDLIRRVRLLYLCNMP